jgi:hypothetical protein
VRVLAQQRYGPAPMQQAYLLARNSSLATATNPDGFGST